MPSANRNLLILSLVMIAVGSLGCERGEKKQVAPTIQSGSSTVAPSLRPGSSLVKVADQGEFSGIWLRMSVQRELVQEDSAQNGGEAGEAKTQDVETKFLEMRRADSEFSLVRFMENGELRFNYLAYSDESSESYIKEEIRWKLGDELRPGARALTPANQAFAKMLGPDFVSAELVKVSDDSMRFVMVYRRAGEEIISTTRTIVNYQKISAANADRLVSAQVANLKLVTELAGRMARSFAGQTYELKQTFDLKDGKWVDSKAENQEPPVFTRKQRDCLDERSEEASEQTSIDKGCREGFSSIDVQSLNFSNEVKGNSIKMTVNGIYPARLVLLMDQATGHLYGELVGEEVKLSSIYSQIVRFDHGTFRMEFRPDQLLLTTEEEIKSAATGKTLETSAFKSRFELKTPVSKGN